MPKKTQETFNDTYFLQLWRHSKKAQKHYRCLPPPPLPTIEATDDGTDKEMKRKSAGSRDGKSAAGEGKQTTKSLLICFLESVVVKLFTAASNRRWFLLLHEKSNKYIDFKSSN